MDSVRLVLVDQTPDIVFYRPTALEQLQQLACSPSMPMQDVPRETLGQHLGFGRDKEEGRDECNPITALGFSTSTSGLRRHQLEHSYYILRHRLPTI